MSLLLEALKKAELAKQGSKPAAGGLDFEAPAAPTPEAAPDKPIITRENLPDISQPLEILSEDLPSASAQPASASIPEPAEPTPAPLQADPEPVYPDGPEPSQAAAKQLFEVKELEDYNPRKPFYYTMGALGLFAVGTVGYFWWQLQPRSIVSASAISAAPSRPPEAAPAPTAPVVAAAGPVNPLSAAAPAASPAAPNPGAAAKTAAPSPATALTGNTAPPPAPEAAKDSSSSPMVITRSSAPAPAAAAATQSPQQARARGTAPQRTAIAARAPQTNPDSILEQAYNAYQAGDLNAARQAYTQALKLDPANRDVLLGLAAIEARSGQHEAAEARYMKLLEADPRDPHAMTGLIALRGQMDPLQSESRLKNMIASQPDAGYLQFALGNQLAMQARWSEAQAAYFKALSAEPENPDYAYNLAISLDHIRQSKLALEYYQKAVALGAARPATFDRSRAAARIRELQQ